MSKTGKFSLQPPSFAGYRLINGSRKICYTSCPLSQELRRKKRLTTVGTHVFYMKAGSSFLEHGLPVQHPKREPRPFENPHYSPPNPEAKAGLTGKPDFARRMKRRNSKEARDTLLFLSTWPAAGGYSASRQKRRRARQSQQRLRKKPWPRRKAARPRGRRTHRTKHSANRVGRRERKGKIHPSSSPLTGATDRWSRAPPYWEKKDGFSRGLCELQR